MPWQSFQNVNVQAGGNSVSRPRFSLTSDIVGFRRCRRQYGYFGNDSFAPAHTVQIFYGTVIHQVLDRCHRHYSGFIPGVAQGSVPTDADIETYFVEVERAMTAHGVRAINQHIRQRAIDVLKAFNRVEGNTLYPRVVDTEYRLEADQQQYVMRGVVDVLAASENADEHEIWDYKGTNRPGNADPVMQDYIWQMCVYAELYRVKTGHFPARAILYFVNELYIPPGGPLMTQRPPRAVYQVNFTPQLIQQGLVAFNQTAQDIIQCKQSQTWAAPTTCPDDATCDICDIRWNCPSRPGQYPLRFPI